jgi:hypothetical protein
MCHPNCGGNTVSVTCRAYGYYGNDCNHSAAGGGGTQCGVTNVCCVITKPTSVTPGADGRCVARQ